MRDVSQCSKEFLFPSLDVAELGPSSEHERWQEPRAIASESCQGCRVSGAVPPGAALPSCSCLKTDPSLKLYGVTMTTALLPTRLESRPSRRQTRVKGAQVLLLAHSVLSETLRRLIATVTCRETLQPRHWHSFQGVLEQVRAAEAAVPSPRYCSTPPLTTSGTETFVSLSFLINNPS